MKTLKQAVKELSIELGYNDETNEELYETFEMKSEVVWTGEPDHHRWYTNFPHVYKLNIDGVDRYFKHYSQRIEGESDPEDCGWKWPDLDELKEVYAKEVTAIVYE